MALDSALSSEAWDRVCEGLAGPETSFTADGFEDSFGSSDASTKAPDTLQDTVIRVSDTQGNSTHTQFPKTQQDSPGRIPETCGDAPARNQETLGDNPTIVTETKTDAVTRITEAQGDKVPETQWGTQTLVPATSLCNNATTSRDNVRQDGRATSDSGSRRLDDSAAYLALLESRLRRIKGQERAVSSREMVSSLAQARQECLDRLLQDSSSAEAFTEDNLGDSSLIQFRRWLAPERVAVTAEELEHLIPATAVDSGTVAANGGTAGTSAAAVSLQAVTTEEKSGCTENESERHADKELPDTGP